MDAAAAAAAAAAQLGDMRNSVIDYVIPFPIEKAQLAIRVGVQR